MEVPEFPDKSLNRTRVLDELRQLVSDNAADKLPVHGEFFYYYGLGQVNRVMPFQDPEWKGYGEKGDQFCKRMYILANDFDNIITILHKIYWLTSQWQHQQLPEVHWNAYIKTDIHSFHAEMRSVCDSIAKAIQISSAKPGHDYGTFERLKTFCEKQRAQAELQIGNELTDLIISADWFTQSRDFRNHIIHFERDVELAYIQNDDMVGILFRTVIGATPSYIYCGPKEFDSGNDGWLMLEPYAGYYLGRLWHFLNEACRLTGERLKLTKSGFSWVNPRLPIALEFISQAIESLEQSETVIQVD